jgi:hypothetical protein
MIGYYHHHYHAMRNNMRRALQLVTGVLGERIELSRPFCGQGVLSPALPPKIRRQRGERTPSRCTEAHTHPISHYHERYHGRDSIPLHLLFRVYGWAA